MKQTMTPAARSVRRSGICGLAAAVVGCAVLAALGERPVLADWGPLEQTALGQLAEQLAPGDMQRLETGLPPGVSTVRELLRVRTAQGRYLAIDAWTDAGHWDPQRHRTFFLGQHHGSKFISYDAQRNRWEELGWAGTPPPEEADGYIYGGTALDPEGGHFYRLAGSGLYRYAIDPGRWTRLGPNPSGDPTPIAWHRELGLLIHVDRHMVGGFDGERWHLLGEAAVHGRTAAARYNAKRAEVMLLGGEQTPRAVTLIDHRGTLRSGAEAPFEHQLSLDNLTYDPQSGRYLVLRWDERRLWEYDADADTWRLARAWSPTEWPFPRFGTVVPIPIDALGVIFWQHEHGPHLYRHRVADAQRSAVAETRDTAPRRAAQRATPLSARSMAPPPEVPQALPGPASAQPHARLAAIGRTMQPGEWRYIGERATPDLTTYPDGMSRLRDLLHVRFCNGDDGHGGTEGNGWTNAWQYDPATQSFWFLAMRGRSEKRLVWLDRELRWGYASMPWGQDCSNNRRPFNRLTLVDGELHWFPAHWGRERTRNGVRHVAPIRPYLEGQSDVRWSLALGAGWGSTQSGQVGDFAVTWVPELRGWIMQQPGSTRPWDDAARLSVSQQGHTAQGLAEQKPWGGAGLWLYRADRDTHWQLFDHPYAQGFQGLLLYNPIKQQVLQLPGAFGPPGSAREFGIIHLGGGRDGGPWLEKLDRVRGGAVHGYSAATSYLAYHPLTGQWLWMCFREQTMWISDDARDWQVYEDFTEMADSPLFPAGVSRFHGAGGLFGASASIQVTPVPGTDLLLWFDYYAGLILHRMQAAGGTTNDRSTAAAPSTGQAQPERVWRGYPSASAALSDSWLLRTAALMSPGDWQSLEGVSLPEGLRDFGAFWTYGAVKDDSSDFWAPVAAWNPVDGRSYAILDRTAGGDALHSVVFLSYDARTHRFLHNPLPPRTLGSRFGAPHVYGRWALDVGRQRVYRFRDGVWVYHITSGRWEHQREVDLLGMGDEMSPIAVHEGLGEFLAMDQSGTIHAWHPDTGRVRVIGANPAQVGRHAHAHYNWVRNEWVIAFGDGGDVATIVTGDEQVIPITIPAAVRQGGSATAFFFYDPSSGNYLAFEHRRRQLWEYDPDAGRWAMALDLGASEHAFPPFHGYLITPIPEAGVILWLHRSTRDHGRHQRLYKHRSAFEPGSSR